MKKNDAINIVNKYLSLPEFSNDTTHFSNINSAKNVWWYDIPTSKAYSDKIAYINILAVNHEEERIHYMKVPTSMFKENMSEFIVRDEKMTISLELSANKIDFLKDIRPGSGGVSFRKFWKIDFLTGNE